MNENNTLSLKIFISGYSITKICDQILIFLIPIIAYKITNDISKSGIIFAVEWIARILLLPFIGTIVDKYSARKIFILFEYLRIFILFIIIITMYHSSISEFLLLNILAIVTGLMGEFGYVSNEVIIVNLYKNSFHNTQKYTQIIDQISLIISPGIAALLVKFTDFKVILIFISILLLTNPSIILFKTKNVSPIINSINDKFEESFIRILKRNKIIAIILTAFF